MVIGTIVGTGRLRKGPLGCRIERAKVESICLSKDGDMDYDSLMVRVADYHGVPVLSFEDTNALRVGFIDYEEGSNEAREAG
jgi:ribosomal protein L7Ae-like RNA K-turn-binding protein